ncbi:hypothetical protein EVAR_37411_1 [Eumeta japonica]|uniref:Uncharacterized protein n=1 Tax=Eumeta variegata TaxID=151549 RepID=A0A4C1WH01_EUMVA|nr:hypothetical protein EVAR_37411_1 [Eumeta japonica]
MESGVRIRMENATEEEQYCNLEAKNDTNKSPYDLVKQFWQRGRMNAAERLNDGVSTTAAGAIEAIRI